MIRNISNSRRGVSSVVGALLFTVLMIAAFSVLSLALDAQTDIVSTQRLVADVELKKQQERFSIVASSDTNDMLQINVNNRGQNPIEISSFWIINKTLSEQPSTRFSVPSDSSYIPGGHGSQILNSQTLHMVPGTYDVKVISTLGTIETYEMVVGTGASSGGLRAEMIADPPDVIIGQNVTVAMVVTNTGLELIKDVSPNALTVTPASAVVSSSPHFPSAVDLISGESVMFTWDYTLTGNSGEDITFSSWATGTFNSLPEDSNVVSDVSTMRLPTDGGDVPDPDILADELLARPQLFFVIPSSQGKSANAEALWGLNVVNPINADMQVSKLVITAFAPGANNNDKLFERGGGSCVFNPVSPIAGPDSNWSCPSENALMWQSDTPVTVPGNSTKSFLTKVEPGKPSGTASLESIIVQGSVFTNLGSFGKSGYQSAMSGTSSSIINIYLTNNTASPRNDNNIQSSRVGILPNSVQTFHAVLADMDLDSSTTLNSGAQLIINVPKGWTQVTVTDDSGFVGTPSVTTLGDTSNQIIGVTESPLGDATNDFGTISFTARAPNVSSDQLYVMYVLGQGTTSSNFSVGPLAEVVLQVDG
ncbi:hypothetical protein NsoK4_03110 [Nitrosopumilus sp. K4]|uniref:hypothetical protein n=1 Tax=Nitrosopumilus sp. K4 TaxID=2795383 RepID=UPI001BABC519|nr:hypothetical protein [Nitrosopumilus sp. K4]QUC65257.1 hypothetical protein NsoK4_03110 [Nitrosopumilus sp. K4]